MGKGLVPPLFVSFLHQLYKTGALKIDCVALKFESFDDATVKQILPVQESHTAVDEHEPSPNNGERHCHFDSPM